jgi:hypothetical protein
MLRRDGAGTRKLEKFWQNSGSHTHTETGIKTLAKTLEPHNKRQRENKTERKILAKKLWSLEKHKQKKKKKRRKKH